METDWVCEVCAGVLAVGTDIGHEAGFRGFGGGGVGRVAVGGTWERGHGGKGRGEV